MIPATVWKKHGIAPGDTTFHQDLGALNVLVVDDNANARRMTKEVLRAFGVTQIIEASDGAGAIDNLKKYKVDIVICDINMAPLDGIEFVHMLRTASDSPAPYTPVIMLSAHTERTRVAEARDAGANEFVVKPFSPRSLYNHLLAVIYDKRLYIRSEDFFGPDRRRQNSGPPNKSRERRFDT